MMSLKNFSIADWLKQLGRTCRRFPVAVLLLVFLTAYLMLLIRHDGIAADGKWSFFFVFFPATGALLAVSLQLLTEDFKHRLAAVITQVTVLALWLGVSLYLTQFERFSMQQLLGVSATVVTMVLSLFLLCFYHKDDDVPFWNFAQRLIVALVAGPVVGGILSLGIILFVQSLDWLFGISVDGWFPYIPTFCMVLLAPVLTMSQIPDGKHKRIHYIAPYTGFIKGVVQYLFIPLLLLYMATLYVYAAKILFTWQLPVGWVCYLVSASMLGMVIVCIGLLLCRNRRIWWVPASFAVLLFLISVGPWSIPNVTEHRLQDEVREAFMASGYKQLPLNGTQYDNWLKSADKRVAKSIDAKLHYLQLDYGYDSTLGLVGKDAIIGTLDRKEAQGDGADSAPGQDLHYYNTKDYLMARMNIPQGYTHMESVDDIVPLDQPGGNLFVFDVISTADGDVQKYRFEVSINQFAKRDQERNHSENVEPLILENGNAAFVVSYFSLTLHDNRVIYPSVSGILFTK